MNKFIIGLLLAAVAATTFFVLRKNEQVTPADRFDRSAIIGSWNEEGPGNVVDFTKEGIFIQRLDSLIDSSFYEWNKEDALVFSKEKTDSVKRIFTVLKLTKDSLLIRGTDSAEVLFSKRERKD